MSVSMSSGNERFVDTVQVRHIDNLLRLYKKGRDTENSTEELIWRHDETVNPIKTWRK